MELYTVMAVIAGSLFIYLVVATLKPDIFP